METLYISIAHNLEFLGEHLFQFKLTLHNFSSESSIPFPLQSSLGESSIPIGMHINSLKIIPLTYYDHVHDTNTNINFEMLMPPY